MVTETRAVLPFTRVELQGQGDVTLTQGSPQGVVVSTDDNIMPLVRTRVVNGTLEIGLAPGTTLLKVTKLQFDVVVPGVRGVKLSGAGTISSPGQLTGKDLLLELGGAGTITVDAAVTTLTAVLSGAGTITVTGTAQSENLTNRGVGALDTKGLTAGSATVTSSGTGNVTVNVTGDLSVNLSGTGDVRYNSEARLTTLKVTGPGSVHQY